MRIIRTYGNVYLYISSKESDNSRQTELHHREPDAIGPDLWGILRAFSRSMAALDEAVDSSSTDRSGAVNRSRYASYNHLSKRSS